MAKRVESPSSINTFKQCPRKYYYQYIEKLPVLPNIHQVRGNIAHDTLEHFYDLDYSAFTGENYALKIRENIQKIFFVHWKQAHKELSNLHLHPDQEKFYFEETMLMLMNWTNHFISDIALLMEKKKISPSEAFLLHTPIREQEFVSEEHAVHGFIDAIHRIEEEIHIIDYKTNSSFDFKDSIRLQLAIYSLLYQEKHKKTPDKVGIFFLRQKLKLINVDQELIDLAKTEIAAVHAHTSKTEQKQDYPCNITPLCKWSSGKCDFYDTCLPHKK